MSICSTPCFLDLKSLLWIELKVMSELIWLVGRIDARLKADVKMCGPFPPKRYFEDYSLIKRERERSRFSSISCHVIPTQPQCTREMSRRRGESADSSHLIVDISPAVVEFKALPTDPPAEFCYSEWSKNSVEREKEMGYWWVKFVSMILINVKCGKSIIFPIHMCQ